MSSSSNPQSLQPPDHKVTFGEVLFRLLSPRSNNSSSSINNRESPAPLQAWLGQNVYPSLTPMRIFFFSLGLMSSLLAYGSFTQTEFYKSSHYPRQLLFVAALVCHSLWLILVLFFRFCTVDRHHYALKSLGEVVVLVLVSCLMLEIGHKHRSHGSDEVAVLATCIFLDVDAICLINLLTPGHHFSLLDSIVTLTLHVGLLGMGSIHLRIFAMCLVFLILLVKNFQWRHVGDAQATSNEQHQLVWVALEV